MRKFAEGASLFTIFSPFYYCWAYFLSSRFGLIQPHFFRSLELEGEDVLMSPLADFLFYLILFYRVITSRTAESNSFFFPYGKKLRRRLPGVFIDLPFAKSEKFRRLLRLTFQNSKSTNYFVIQLFSQKTPHRISRNSILFLKICK